MSRFGENAGLDSVRIDTLRSQWFETGALRGLSVHAPPVARGYRLYRRTARRGGPRLTVTVTRRVER